MKKINKKILFISIAGVTIMAFIALWLAERLCYCSVQNHSPLVVARSNARIIMASVNAHNVIADEDDTIPHILFKTNDERGVILINELDDSLLASVEKFDDACEINLTGMTNKNFCIALEYIFIDEDGELALDEEYDHTKENR